MPKFITDCCVDVNNEELEISFIMAKSNLQCSFAELIQGIFL